ncbi:MAG: DUF4340 domain-containing protein [Gammaproteobacteria bacterium]|nr:DUF4340 domain-containing protein [Gammaproteobacteria bacterium]
MKLKTFLLLVVITGLVAWGAYTTLQPEQGLPKVGEKVFPALLDEVNQARVIDIQSGGEQFEVDLKDGHWQVPSRHGYPADEQKVRELLLGASELTYLEPKTSNKALMPKLGLDDPGKADSSAVRIEVEDGSGETLARLTIGNRKPARGNPSDEEIHVLPPTEDQAWTVRGRLPYAASTVLDWMNREIVKVDSDRILSVHVRQPDGYELEVYKQEPGDTNFKIRGLQADEKIDDAWRVNDIGRVFMSLELDDVMPADEVSVPEKAYQVSMLTYDGMRFEARIWQQDDKVLGDFSVRYDESLRDELPQSNEKSNDKSGDGATESTDKSANGDDGKAAVDPAGRSVPLPPALLDAEAARQEVDRIAARIDGWVYEIPDFKLDYLKRRKSDLLAKPEPAASDTQTGPAAETGGSGEGASSSSPEPAVTPPASTNTTGG